MTQVAAMPLATCAETRAPRRVAYLVHQYLPRQVGGTELYTQGLARRWIARGGEALVLAYHESRDGGSAVLVPGEHDGIRTIELRHDLGPSARRARHEYLNDDLLEPIARALADFAPDVVHVTHPMKLSGAALAACRLAGVPYVLTATDYWLVCMRHTLLDWAGRACPGPTHAADCLRCAHELHGVADHAIVHLPRIAVRAALTLGRALGTSGPFWRDARDIADRNATLRELALGARCLVALTDFQRAILVAHGYPPSRVHVIPHGIETDHLPPRTRVATHPIRVLFVGSLVPHKGPRVLLDALARIPDARLACRVVGAIDARAPYVRDLIATARRDPRVVLVGQLDPAALGAEMAEADVLVLPALWYENAPIVVQAARHVGLHVVTSRIGSLADLLADDPGATLLRPGDVPALAHCLAELARAPRAIDGVPRAALTMDEHARRVFATYDPAPEAAA